MTIVSQTFADPDTLEARAARRLLVLEQLSAIGTKLTEALGWQVSDAAEVGDEIDAGAGALKYSRLSRAVRRTVVLKRSCFDV
jgi:hypothetical protein